MTKPVLLLTRPAPLAQGFVDRLAPGLRARLQIVLSPMMELVPVGTGPDLAGIAGVVFTSQNAVPLAGAGRGRPAYCVGPATAEAAAAAGWRVALTAPDAARLVPALIEMAPPAPLVHLAGAQRRAEIGALLTEAGLPCGTQTLYRQDLRPLSVEGRAVWDGADPVIVALFSPRSARHFAQQAGHRDGARYVVISAAVAAELPRHSDGAVEIAPTPDGAGMVQALQTLVGRGSAP